MQKRLYSKVFGDMAAYLGMYSDDFSKIEPHLEKAMDGAKLHCLYLIQDFQEGCQANCAFCTQGKDSKYNRREAYLVKSYLIKYPMDKLITMMKNGFIEKREIKRICFSSVYNEKTNENLLEIFNMIRSVSDVQLTACCIPDSRETLVKIKEAGAERVVINYETCTSDLFEKHRGKYRNNSPYTWEKVNKMVDEALEVFGPNRVGTHLIIGLGETQKEALKFIQSLYDKKINVSLFAFRPVPNTDLENHEQISHKDYHIIQTARYLIMHKKSRFEDMCFDNDGKLTDYGFDKSELLDLVNTGKPYLNMGGCPNCNRINYDNSMKERYYNYPRSLTPEEIDVIRPEIIG